MNDLNNQYYLCGRVYFETIKPMFKQMLIYIPPTWDAFCNTFYISIPDDKPPQNYLEGWQGLREEILTKLFKLNILIYHNEIYEILRRLGVKTLLLKLIHQHHAYCKQEGSTILEL